MAEIALFQKICHVYLGEALFGLAAAYISLGEQFGPYSVALGRVRTFFGATVSQDVITAFFSIENQSQLGKCWSLMSFTLMYEHGSFSAGVMRGVIRARSKPIAFFFKKL